MTERNPRNIDRKSTQITVIDKCTMCSVDVLLRSSGAKTRQNLQSTVPSAAALQETSSFCLSDGKVHVTVFAGGKGCLILSVAVVYAGLIDLTLLDENMQLSQKI